MEAVSGFEAWEQMKEVRWILWVLEGEFKKLRQDDSRPKERPSLKCLW